MGKRAQLAALRAVWAGTGLTVINTETALQWECAFNTALHLAHL